MKKLLALTALIGGGYWALETDSGRATVSTISSQIPGRASDADDSNADSSQHAHYAVENLRRTSSDRYRYELTTARRLGAIKEPVGEPKLVGAHVNDLREVMRFDISPSWVLNRFARVTTVLADLQLQGLRVPIVTGTRADDLAGTLTYYFDSSEKLQRITIHGFTGDPNRLVATMSNDYGLQREPTLEAGVFTKRWNGYPIHFLRLTHAPVVHADAVHQKYTVFLELNEPDLAYGISREARRVVAADRETGRW